MARDYQIPGGAFISGTGTRDVQVPGRGFVNDTSATATTSIYTKSRKVHTGMSTGGAAQSRGSIVNSGGV